MSLQAFSFPLPETRFFKAGSFVYRFKIRGGSSYREEVIGENYINQELEDIIRAVLANLDSLQPFSSTHFNVFPYKKQWERVCKLMFKHGEEKLTAYPFIITLYLENNPPSGKQAEHNLTPEKEAELPSSSEPQAKRSKRDSPLEGAILKDIIMDAEAETQVYISGTYVDNPRVEEEVEDATGDDDQKGTEKFLESQWEAGIGSQVATAQGETTRTGTLEEVEEEEEEEEEKGADVDGIPQSPVRTGLLTRLVSHVFPFSMFFKES